jgi:hypothetical protein
LELHQYVPTVNSVFPCSVECFKLHVSPCHFLPNPDRSPHQLSKHLPKTHSIESKMGVTHEVTKVMQSTPMPLVLKGASRAMAPTTPKRATLSRSTTSARSPTARNSTRPATAVRSSLTPNSDPVCVDDHFVTKIGVGKVIKVG